MPETKAVRAALPDGTSFDSLIDVERRTVSPRLFDDVEVLRFELNRLLPRCWLLVGHASEIPDPGDFVTRGLGKDPILVTRRADGEVSVLLNTCLHQGALVCRDAKGHANRLVCPVHNWTYTLDGTLVSGESGDEDSEMAWATLKRARVAEYAGTLWATFDGDAPSLESFIGDADLGALQGRRVFGSPLRVPLPENWKVAIQRFHGGEDLPRALLGAEFGESARPAAAFFPNIGFLAEPIALLISLIPSGISACTALCWPLIDETSTHEETERARGRLTKLLARQGRPANELEPIGAPFGTPPPLEHDQGDRAWTWWLRYLDLLRAAR